MDPAHDFAVTNAAIAAAGASQTGSGLRVQRIVGANVSFLAEAENAAAAAVIGGLATEGGELGGGHGAGERLAQEDANVAGRQAERAGIAIGARESLLQLLRVDVVEVGELIVPREKKITGSAPTSTVEAVGIAVPLIGSLPVMLNARTLAIEALLG